MLSNILNRLKDIDCEYVHRKNEDILMTDYGISSCNKNSCDTNFKYYKIQKDFLDYYSSYSKAELKSLDLLFKSKTKSKLDTIISSDDELYIWFLNNITNINIALNKPQHSTHVQKVASLTWVFNHNLGFEVNIEVLDEDNNPLLGYTRVDSNNFNTITLTWSVAVKGKIIAS